jgi:hypothetical protein
MSGCTYFFLFSKLYYVVCLQNFVHKKKVPFMCPAAGEGSRCVVTVSLPYFQLLLLLSLLLLLVVVVVVVVVLWHDCSKQD